MSSTVSVVLAMAPAPSARITVSTIPGTVAYVQIWRGDGSTETRVMGDSDQVPAGALFIVDYRVPLGRSVTYRVVTYTAAGVVVDTATSSAVLASSTDPNLAWVMDPEDPTTALLLPLMAGTDAEISHQSSGVVVHPLVGLPRLLGGPRTTHARPFILSTGTLAETTQFANMIKVGGQLLVRPDPSVFRHDTGLIYVGMDTIIENPRHPNEGPARWSFTGTEVEDDGWPVVVAARSWLDLEATFADWPAVEAAYATWLAVEQG